MGIQRLNKKGVQIKSGFFAVIAVSMFVIAIGIIVGGWNTAYGSGIESDLGAFNKLDNVSSDVNIQKGRLSPNDPEPSGDPESNTFRGVYGILTNIYQSFDLVFGNEGMLDSVTTRLGIPDYVRQGLIALMVAALTFALIAIIFRLGRSSA